MEPTITYTATDGRIEWQGKLLSVRQFAALQRRRWHPWCVVVEGQSVIVSPLVEEPRWRPFEPMW